MTGDCLSVTTSRLRNRLWINFRIQSDLWSSVVLSILLSIPLGLLAGYYKNKWIDNIVSGISYLGISLPAFWFGIMMIILFSLNLGWLPSSGMHAIGHTSTGDLIKHAILPTLVLSVNNTAVFVRYIRANTLSRWKKIML